MFRNTLRLPSPAFVISLIALSLVLGGTAIAASTTTHGDAKADQALVKQLAPKLSVKHATTADSATTAAAATGLPGPLEFGQMERGAWAVAGHKVNNNDFVAEEAISFPIPLALAPQAVNFVTGGATAKCPGSYQNPGATTGQLCVFFSANTGGTGMTYSALTEFGVTIRPTGVGAGANYEMNGTWAVGAP